MLSAFISFLQLIFPFAKEWIFGKSSAAGWIRRNISISIITTCLMIMIMTTFGVFDRFYQTWTEYNEAEALLAEQKRLDEEYVAQIADLTLAVNLCSRLTNIDAKMIVAHAALLQNGPPVKKPSAEEKHDGHE